MGSFKPGVLYKALTELPVPASARFMRGSGEAQVQIEATFSISDQLRNIKRSISQSFVAIPGQGPLASTPQTLADVVLTASSRYGDLQARLRQVSGDSGKKRYVEIWRGVTLEVQKDVTDIHDEFYGDESIGGIAFSPSQDAVLYTAERKAKEPSKADTATSYDKFRFKPSFGEGYGEKKLPAFFMLRWDSTLPSEESTVRRLNFTDEHQTLFGQPVFSPSDSKVVYATGYENTKDGRLLGLKACLNRPSAIWQIRLSDNPVAEASSDESESSKRDVLECESVQLTDSALSSRSPQVTSVNGKETLVWLANASGGPHASASMLQSALLGPSSFSGSIQTLVSVVDEPSSSSPFPGLYPGVSFASEPFMNLAGTPYIAMHSVWESRQVVLLSSLLDGKVLNITPAEEEDGLHSWSLLGTDGGSRVICSRSSPNTPSELVLGVIDEKGSVDWTVLYKPTVSAPVEAALSTLKTRILPVPGRGPTQVIVQTIQSDDQNGVAPVILGPHGGPHATVTTAFSPMTAALTLEGFTSCTVNYTGSLGFGDTNVRALQGHCGTLDVEDCYEALQLLVKEGLAVEGPGKVFVSGGSHGGFLAGHLIGQYPSTFTAAVLANPVISAGEIAGTDIPDWYYAEFGLGDDLQTASALPAETYGKLQALSPISHAEKVTANVLLLIGAADRRVAPTQGMNYYHALKAAGKAETDMLVFPGQGHGLEGVEETRARFEAVRDWFVKARK